MLVLALALGVATAAPPQARLPIPVIIDMPTVIRERACGLRGTLVEQRGPAPAPRKLGDLPPANLEYAVLRLDANGCQKPVVVRYDYRGDGHFATGAAK